MKRKQPPETDLRLSYLDTLRAIPRWAHSSDPQLEALLEREWFAEAEQLRLEIERDAASGRKSRVKGAEASHELYGTPEERQGIKADVRHFYEELRAKLPPAVKNGAIHATLAWKFKVTQRTIRRYLKE